MKKVLVLEDESSIRSFIVINLRRAGYEVVEAETGEEALEKLKIHSDVRVALLDIMLPGIDGFEVCRRIRATNAAIGIIMLTARSQEMDKVTGLMTGADDYVTKPFSMRILLKKVYVILSRKSQEANIYDDGFLKVDFELGIVRQGAKECLLSPTEYRILKKLIENKGKLLTYSVLLDSLWDEGVQITDKHTLAVNINRLRKKIETEEHTYISNVYGMGYIWK